MHTACSEKLVFIGAGNVATFLATRLKKAGCRIGMIYSRTSASAEKLAGMTGAEWTTSIDRISEEGTWIFSLTDQAITDMTGRMGSKNCFLVHTAGSLPINLFQGHADEYGVLYPLQTISGRQDPSYDRVPLCIESNTEEGYKKLDFLARLISPSVYRVNSEKRLQLHLAAVFACNFTNHMYALAEKIASKAGLPFEMYHELIRETAMKAARFGPRNTQTGPAARNDELIIKKHLDLLSYSPRLQDIYGQLTRSIQMDAGDSNEDPEK